MWQAGFVAGPDCCGHCGRLDCDPVDGRCLVAALVPPRGACSDRPDPRRQARPARPWRLGRFSYVLPGAAIEHDGVIHAWLVWFTELPDTQMVTHASSPDGRTWTIDPDPAYTDLGLGLFVPGPIPADAGVEADGTWVLYGWGTPDASRRTFMSWRATAPGPNGPWTAQRILGPGDDGHWDDNGVLMTSVVTVAAGLELSTKARRAGHRRPRGSGSPAPTTAWIGRASPRPGPTQAADRSSNPASAAASRPGAPRCRMSRCSPMAGACC